MNLIELSKETNQSLEQLRQDILEEFGKIILSEYNNLQDSIVEHYLSSNVSCIATIENDNDKVDLLLKKEENDCLEELKDIQHPKLAYTKQLLKYCIEKKYLIFIDTCSLLNENFMDFYGLFVQQRNLEDVSLYIPYVVIEELKRIILDGKKEEEIIEKAIDILGLIDSEEGKSTFVIVGNEDDKRANEHGEKVIHADRVIIEKLIYFRNDSRSSLFITQDYDATVDALKQNDWHSTKSKALILVKKIIREGALVDNAKDTINPELPIDKKLLE